MFDSLFRIFMLTLISYHAVHGSLIRYGPGHVNLMTYFHGAGTVTMWCWVDETAEISSLTWSKTFAGSTELIYNYDGNSGTIIPEPPPNMIWKYRVLESNVRERKFNLEISNGSFTDAGIYECRLESSGYIYTAQGNFAIYGVPRMTQTPAEVPDNHEYSVECSVEVFVASVDSSYMPYVRTSIYGFIMFPYGEEISGSQTWMEGLETFEQAPLVWRKNFTRRASFQDEREVMCRGLFHHNDGPYDPPPFTLRQDIKITFLPRNSVIISVNRDIHSWTGYHAYYPFWCHINETAKITSLTWSRTFGSSTLLIYYFDGNEGSIIPEPPSNSTSKYGVMEMIGGERRFSFYILDISFEDVGVYECRVESNGYIYTEQAKLAFYGEPKITQTPVEVLDNSVYSVECSIEVGVASIDSDYISSIEPSINDLFLTPAHKPISESQTWVDGLRTFEHAPPVWHKNFTTRASQEDQWEAICSGVFYDGGPAFEDTKEVRITRNPVITKGPGNQYPRVKESSTVLLECQVNETADISLVAWSKTFLGSTELIYRYGNEGKIISPPPSDVPCKYRVLESHEQERHFNLEIGNITLSDVGIYECTVESNGQNYTEQANVSVYGSPRLIQIPEIVLNGEWNYTFLCSVEVAVASNTSELITSAKPNITAWYANSDPVYLEPVSSGWTGLDPFGGVMPVYSEEYFVFGQADYYNPYFLNCAFSTPEPETFQESQSTQIGVPAKDIKLTPIIGTTFYPGDTITCYSFGNPMISIYQWFERREPTVPRVEGQVLTLNHSDLGDNEWICKATNYINGVPYTVESRRKWFTVGNREITVITRGPDNHFPSALESTTILLECQVNEAAHISLVTWSKTFLGSTELIYTYDGNEGKIFPPPPSNLPWKYRVRDSHENDRNFYLEIADITLLDVGTYECMVESNGRNYTEEADVLVYGSSRITQIPEIVLQGETYNFSCSVEVALVHNSSEQIKSVLPTIAASYRPDITSDPIRLSSLGSKWTGLDTFGETIPVYTEDYNIADDANDDNSHFLQCTFSTPEGEMFHELQFTHVGVPVKDVEMTPTGSRFYPGDEITCTAYGRPEISSYQWFYAQELSAPRVEGQVLILRDADLGDNRLTCVATNYINGIEYSSSKSKSFTVVANSDTRPGSEPVALLLAFSVVFLGI